MKKIPWDMEEMVALADLYYRYENGMISNLSKELYDLSKCLINRADLLMITHDEKYRNVNGINMIFQKIDCQVKCNTIREKNFEAPRRESEN